MNTINNNPLSSQNYLRKLHSEIEQLCLDQRWEEHAKKVEEFNVAMDRFCALHSNPLSPEATKFFLQMSEESHHWNGIPILDCKTNEQKGYTTAMKVHGLLTTEADEENTNIVWVFVTPKGIQLAEQLGQPWGEIY